MHVLALSLGKGILKEGSRERIRMERYAAHLSSYHIIVLTPGETAIRMQSGNLFIYTTGRQGKLGIFLKALQIGVEILKQGKHDRVITAQDPFEVGSLGFMLSLITKVPFQVQLHGDFYGSTWRRERVLNSLRLRLGLFLMRKAKNIRVVSLRIKRSLMERGIAEGKIVVLPIRAELETFLQVKRIPAGDGAPVRVLTASRLASEKNIVLILESVAAIVGAGGHVSLEIVGSGPEENLLRGRTATLSLTPHVRFTSWVEDMAAVYARADIFVLASNNEGYGLVLLEALASGIPVVTTDVGAAGEVVVHEEHGFVVPVGDSEGYKSSLAKLVFDAAARERMGAAGKHTAKRLSEATESEYIKAWVASLSW